MALYLINYDLRAPEDYAPLYAQLDHWRAKRLLSTVWVAELRGPALVVRDILSALIGSSDRLVVLELKYGSDWSGMRAEESGIQWLRINIHP